MSAANAAPPGPDTGAISRREAEKQTFLAQLLALEGPLENLAQQLGRAAPAVGGGGNTIAASDDSDCRVCMEAKKNHAFVPCGHIVCCEKCASALKTCPACRAAVTGILKVYDV